MEPLTEQPSHCCRVTREIMPFIGDRWSVLVVASLWLGRKRFSELRREIDDISQKMLTSALRNLERDGYVRRTVHPTVPPQVDYELTDLGKALSDTVRVLGDFARQNQARILASRATFDGRSGGA